VGGAPGVRDGDDGNVTSKSERRRERHGDVREMALSEEGTSDVSSLVHIYATSDNTSSGTASDLP
jgi:hypothetical protein